MSMKFQITLPDELAIDLKQTAARMKIPLAQFIRETMEEKLRVTRMNRNKSAKHPLANIIGLIDEGPDLAARVDEILYR